MKQLVNLFGRKAKIQATESRTRLPRRSLRSEALEKRQLLAGDLLEHHNYGMPEDVNGDWRVTPLDALLVLNHISRSASGSSVDGSQTDAPLTFPDVTGSGEVTPLDALLVLNRIARGEAESVPLLQLHLNARSADDTPLSASVFNPETRELTIGVGEIFNLEVNYTDLRPTNATRLGAFQIAVDMLFETGVLEPALTEVQQIRLLNFDNAASGNILFNLEGRTESALSFSFEDFDDNPVGVIRSAVNGLGFTNATVISTGSGFYDIRFNDLSLVNEDLANLIVTPQLSDFSGTPIAATATVRDFAPRINGEINPAAIRYNIDFDSRTFTAPFDQRSGRSFYGGLVFDGSFDPAIGLVGLTGVGPSVVGGWDEFVNFDPRPLPRPFDAFSIPVQFVQPTTDFEIRLGDSSRQARNLLYGLAQPQPTAPLPPDLIRIDDLPFTPIFNSAGVITNAPGVILATAVQEGGVSVVARAGTLPLSQQNGAAVSIDLDDLVTVNNDTGSTRVYQVGSPSFGSVVIDQVTGVATFTPPSTQSGTTSFVYSVTVDGVTGTGTITANVAPLVVTAGSGSVGAVQNGDPVNFNLNDFVTAPGSTGLTRTFTKVSDPSFGSVSVQPNGSATFTPALVGFGPTTFNYSVTIGGVTSTGTVTVNVTALPVTVVAEDIPEPLEAVQSGSPIEFELSSLVTVGNGDGLPRSFSITTPTLGSATVNASTGRLVYSPPTTSFGTASLDYTVTVNGVSDTGTITINVAREPVVLSANPGSLTAFRNGTPVTIDLNSLISVTPAGTQVTFELIAPTATLGTVSLLNGIATYTPSATQSGDDSFRYRVRSEGDDVKTAEATVSVTVNQEITVSAADNQFEAIQGGAAIVINPFPGSLVQTSGTTTVPTITLNTAGVKGTVSFVGGVLTYTPPNTRFTTDSFSYSASLPAIPGFAGATDTGVITITEVASITARPSNVTALPGDPAQVINLANLVTVTGTDVAPTFTINSVGLAGTAVLDGNSVTYTPPATEFGTTSFSYTASVAGKSSTATVTISEGISIQTLPGSLVSFPGGPAVSLSLPTLVTVSGSSVAPIYALATTPSVGTAVVNPSTGLLTYTPPATGAFGQISFNYRVTVDGVVETNTITVTQLTVDAPNRTLTVNEAVPNVAPQGTPLQLTATVSVNLPPVFTIVTPPSLGTATIVGNTLTYTPRAFDFNQTVFTDSIVYRATVNGVSDTGTIAVTINPTVLAPTAAPDSVNAVANTSTTFTSVQLTQNDSTARPNPSGQRPLVTGASAIMGTTVGSVVFNQATNSITYTPPADFTGETSFNYTITSEGQTATGVVTVLVREFIPSSISGSIFTDFIASVSNPVRNGVQDANEPAIGGVQVRVFSAASQNAFGQVIERTVRTDAEGVYDVPNLPPGTYTVTFQTPDTLIFGSASSSSSLPSTVAGQSFVVEIGEIGGINYAGLNFTVLGRTGAAAGTSSGGSGSLLVSQYLLTDPNSPFNSSRPDFGLATMIVNPTTGQQQVFELTQGYENVLFAEIKVSPSGTTAILTLIMEDGRVRSAVLSRTAGDFVVNSTSAVVQVFRNASSLSFVNSSQAELTAQFGDYRSAVDAVLASGNF
ncbi:MAG TPA: hypothetical protein DDZ51_26140 [Planctomycetaceae bacterium]|nr:hypothetical protein [Planctomycetaceae bacterium]